MNIRRRWGIVLPLACLLGACVSQDAQVMGTNQGAVQQRSYQQRAFDTTDQVQALRSVLQTLQDLGFVIDTADVDLGAISATKFEGYELRITVTVRPRGRTQTLVRATAQYSDRPIEDPQAYVDFFTALEKTMFLAAQQVE